MHTEFSYLISNWYRKNKRSLPWRETRNPYHIWLSEIILQQTRVAQGIDYYHKFIRHYPTIKNLAKASEQEILVDWAGLGYYSRARNLHKTAKYIYGELGGVFPDNYDDIIKLSGVGSYTAAAISSFAFGEAKSVVDGNVYRVLSRIFDIGTPIDSSAGKKEFSILADSVFPKTEGDTHNQAMMELGALICKPKNPNCDTCPVNNLCESRAKQNQEIRPVKNKKTKVKSRYLHYFLLKNQGRISVEQRKENGIWKNMFQLPLIETLINKSIELEELNETLEFKNIDHFTKINESVHLLSHQKLHIRFYQITSSLPSNQSRKKGFVKEEDLNKYPFPKPIHEFLKEHIASYA
ncbi:MAG: A/G-specific adenine glycosylase [Lentimonas sp.]|jgi:A/G-specific adenine glycosylase